MPSPFCRECGATLRFITMADSGKRMPVNPVPDPRGRIAARFTGHRWAGGYVLKAGEAPRPGFKVFRTHYADCRPAAAKKTRSESAAARLF
ncbi:MAG: hypothetical protein QM753_06900 [Thermomicrobiales bacterium]